MRLYITLSSMFLALFASAAAFATTPWPDDQPAPGPFAHEEHEHPPAAPPAKVELHVTVDQHGYHPSVVDAPKAGKLTLIFTRTSDAGCGKRVVFPQLGIEKELPLATPVSIEVEAKAGQRIAFTCGMGMYKGSLVVP